MNRRTSLFLPLVILILVAVAIAAWRLWAPSRFALSPWPELEGGVYAEPVTHDGMKYLVPPNEVYESGLGRNGRPALTNPTMSSIDAADTKLADELEGIAVSVGDTHRFYPFQVLNWHEVVNDTVNGVPLAITYSPLTGSAVVYSAQADAATGEVHHFEDSGKVYNNALLLIDTHDTLWNQTSGQAIVGETVGQKLEIYPSLVMSWAAWKDAYPTGQALSTDTGYSRDYGRHPYARYETANGIYFPVNYSFTKLGPKDLVYRVDNGDQVLVFMRRYLPFQTEPNAQLGEGEQALPVVAFLDDETDVVRVFDRRVNGQTLTFERNGDEITDKETGSRWTPEGVATSGRFDGTALTPVPVTRHYAFAHFAMFPNSLISGEELLPKDQTEQTTEAGETEGETIDVEVE